ATEVDVVIGMHGRPGPGRTIEWLGCQRQQRRVLHTLEHHTRDLAGGAVNAGARDVARPADRAGLHLAEVAEALAAEEVLPRVRNAAFDFRFSRSVGRHRGVDDETAVLRVLEEDAVDARRVAVGA